MTPVYLTSTYVQSIAWGSSRLGMSIVELTIQPVALIEACMARFEDVEKLDSPLPRDARPRQLFCICCKPGDHVIAADDMYGGTFRLFDKVLQHHGLQFSYLDLTKTSNLENAIQANTKMIWLESPTNPTLKLSDIQQICQIAKKKNILVVVDNTFMSPYFQRPLELGADIVVHSATKYIGGHSDVVGGVAVTSNPALAEKLAFLSNSMGAIMAPV
jgi:cystathionine gamma-lyase